MLLDTIADISRNCTGCGVCGNTCTKGAITIALDSEGFYHPVIDKQLCIQCGLCEKKCPQINTRTETITELISGIGKNLKSDISSDSSPETNSCDPKCYAVRASDDIVAKSASGGAFSVIAGYVLKKGGVVCGAAYSDDSRTVQHIMISNEEDMALLRGSKYVCSKTGDIYIQVKQKLQEGVHVLFSGTPCQVAALNLYLGNKKYENLITVDLLCGGIPSAKAYNAYLDEISGGKDISQVDFRPKKYGWHYSGIETTMADGTVNMVHSMRDPFLKGFYHSLFTGKACADCNYAELPRQGDFTIGDFWNIENYSREMFHSDGVSCLLLNSEASEKIFHDIKHNFGFLKRMPLSYLRSNNRLNAKRPSNAARQRFFDLIERGIPFSKASEYCLGWKYDIGLTGCWTVMNYGGVMTYYALYSALKEMGHTVIMIETRRHSQNTPPPRPALFRKNPYPSYDISKIFHSLNEEKELNKRVKTFILGSDQVWNPKLFSMSSIQSYTMDYVAEWRKRISYATSFGSVKANGTYAEKNEMGKLLRNLDYISVRESAGVDICKNEFNCEATMVMDPIFLCNEKALRDIAERSPYKYDKDYVFTYFLWPTHYTHGIDKAAEKLNCSLVNTVNANISGLERIHFSKNTWPYDHEENCKAEDWLCHLVNSKFVITDSFHGTCLAIRFRKSFIYVKGHINENCGLDRLTSLLDVVGLKHRIVTSVNEALERDDLFTEIDYDEVYRKLTPEVERSRKWLSDAINADKFNEDSEI